MPRTVRLEFDAGRLALQRRPPTTYRGRASEVRRANFGRAPEQRPRDRGVRRCQLTGAVIADLAQRLQRIVILRPEYLPKLLRESGWVRWCYASPSVRVRRHQLSSNP